MALFLKNCVYVQLEFKVIPIGRVIQEVCFGIISTNIQSSVFFFGECSVLFFLFVCLFVA